MSDDDLIIKHANRVFGYHHRLALAKTIREKIALKLAHELGCHSYIRIEDEEEVGHFLAGILESYIME